MNAWEQRARKLEARRERMRKHGRSLLTAVRDAELRRAGETTGTPRGRSSRRRSR